MTDHLPDLDARLRQLAAGAEHTPMPSAPDLRATGARRQRRRRVAAGVATLAVVTAVAVGTGTSWGAGSGHHHQFVQVVSPPATAMTTPPTTTVPTTVITAAPTTLAPTTTTTSPAPTTSTSVARGGASVPTTAPRSAGTTPTTAAAPLPGVLPCDGDAPSGQTLIRPTSEFFLGCATSNEYVTGQTWSSWTATSATGTGTVHLNSCQPDCAEGSYTTWPALIQLTGPATTDGKLAFQHITVTPTGSTGTAYSESGPGIAFGWVPAG